MEKVDTDCNRCNLRTNTTLKTSLRNSAHIKHDYHIGQWNIHSKDIKQYSDL